jgi:hypothetical protein
MAHRRGVFEVSCVPFALFLLELRVRCLYDPIVHFQRRKLQNPRDQAAKARAGAVPLIEFQCPRCHKGLTAAESARGQLNHCDGCQTSARVPDAAIAKEARSSPSIEGEWGDRPEVSGSARQQPRTAGRVWLWVVLLVGGVFLLGVLACVGVGVVGGLYLKPKVDEAKEDLDLKQTKILTMACKSYKLDHGDWPPNLEALAPGNGAPYADPAAMEPHSVPNGRFQCDRSGKRNQGLKPDIWVDGPRGPIGNWMTTVGRK